MSVFLAMFLLMKASAISLMTTLPMNRDMIIE